MIDQLHAQSHCSCNIRASVTEGYVRHLLPLAGLAPDITETILDGSAPSTLTLDMLMRDLPLDWAAQRVVLNHG